MKILETSQQYNQRIMIEEKKLHCPECGNINFMFRSYHTEYKSIFSLKSREITTYRCTCGCKFECEGEWR